ncbi:alpha/beta fold hydrolase BchO [Porphyrobacter sp. LM 6]|uniref:alpha/beta fold hydrolase BchO n=1 Tax=Porphyrobacter sp. LM 6 TaxID=1896196 RepID=UPI000846B7F0|nr:alpha/beta fold hydrolase BchO [Porphyrobacter sp. LM 6]AOL95572.1 magnesium chelatase accessory protein [Porphyrobacter sp. LM 6]
MSRLDWQREGRIWPHREASRFIDVGPARWHVQRMGAGPPLLLLHGTGASVHSWRGLMPLLAEHYDVIAPDLPRHAFTTGHDAYAMNLPAMAGEVAALLKALEVDPAAIIGHSAGAAVALQLALDQGYAGPIVGLNAALRPFPGALAQIFPAIAKTLFANPLVPRLFAGTIDLAGGAQRFMWRSTHSRIDAAGMACYRTLLKNPDHAGGGLAMMANWDLPGLRARMGEVANPVLLVHGSNDPAIPLDWARDAAGWLPDARLELLPGLGHLAHEEAPEKAAALIAAFLAQETLGAD